MLQRTWISLEFFGLLGCNNQTSPPPVTKVNADAKREY